MIAADIMTNDPRTVRVDDSLGEAYEVLRDLDVRHVPVVNNDGDLVGILSDRDLAGRSRESLPKSTTRVADVMSGGVVMVDPQSDVREIIERLLENHISAVPVVDGESKVVGIVSYVDVLRSFEQAVGDAQRAP
jgi:CBS domain-containing protein